LIRRLALAILAAWSLVCAELAVVTLLHWPRVASVWELSRGGVFIAPVALLAAAASAALGLLLFVLLEGSRAPARRVALAGLFALLAAAAAYGIGGGRHLAAPAVRVGFALGLGALVGLGVHGAAAPLRRLLERSPLAFAGAALGLFALFELVNQLVLVRLYPAFHHALAVLALLLSPAVAALWLRNEPARPGRAWAIAPAVLVVLGLLLAPCARKISYFDNFRSLLLEKAPLLSRAVELAALVAPPRGWDEPAPEAIAAVAGGPTQRSLDLEGRDLLLVTVDALRADHLGSYGYQRPTTPALDALAQGGVVFEHAYAATPHTSYSITSLMTGKYMRPLLLQDAGHDSDTWASLLRTYGYRTAAFYPPAVFFIDKERFKSFDEGFLGFEYRWVEFAEGERRLAQVRDYLAQAPRDKPLFVWLHLFGPHEPYEGHAEHGFGERDLDRYDSEIAAADATVGSVVQAFRTQRPQAAVIVTADHGEEFGEHGGRYHGTSVYEEQVRVPLIVSAPGTLEARRVAEPVQTIDLLPTVLASLGIPRPPRVRGRDLGPLLTGRAAPGKGLAYAETDEQALLAEGNLRLICARRVGACQLFDLGADPEQRQNLSGSRPQELEALRGRLRELAVSHGRYEATGLRAEGKGWPGAILRAIAGDGDAAEELAGLLDDADLGIRRKAAELLFELKRREAAPALRLTLGRDEDETVRRWCALALTRLGEGAPLAMELSASGEGSWKRLASLALGESGDARGEAELIAWWQDRAGRDFERSRQLLEAFGTLRSKDAIWPLLQALDDVRLRPYLARALARIGDDAARGPLVAALRDERSQSSRRAIVEALVELRAREELAAPLVRFLGTPDPLSDGLALATRAEILHHVGGPKGSDLKRLREQSALGVTVPVVVPRGGNGRGVRLLVRARARGSAPAELIFGSAAHLTSYTKEGTLKKQRGLPSLDPEHSVRVMVPPGELASELALTLPATVGARPGQSTRFIVYAGRDAEIEAFCVVPLSDELPPPPPKPWAGEGRHAPSVVGGAAPAPTK
jgi:hypothetical protein